ncbi:calcium-binding protein [Hamadaea tsunoensis]|uniref:calcium-binding protein n=1 Tax=Hamadaea tsunoensis TaxID=53368 RepID=UPI00042354A2|nr:calcium-binding protein [Hamadaea tsunoensis]
MRRLSVLAAATLVVALVPAVPAHAAGAVAYISGTTLYYVDTPGAFSTRLIVRSSGSTYTLDADHYVLASTGCAYPVPTDTTLVACTGTIDTATIKMDGGDDLADFYPSTTAIVSRIYGGSGNDQLLGADGTDYLYGEAGNDYLDGYDGMDWLAGGSGTDQLFGGAGWGDMASYADHTADVNISIDAATGNDGAAGEGDTIGTDVEMLEGGSGNDKLVGSDDDNILRGCGGNDVLYGRGGSDALYGDGDGEYGEDGHDNDRWNGCTIAAIGADYFSGGAGHDMVGYHLHTAAVHADLDGATGDDGGAGEGDTIASDVEDIAGGYGDDVLIGDAGPNILNGGPGNDQVYGLAGDDWLVGEGGDDKLYAAAGADSITGGAGSDLCDLGGDGLSTEECEVVLP